MRMTERVSYRTIVAATEGDAVALNMVLRHYGRYINHFSKRRFYDDYGNSVEIVDDEIRQQIEIKLMLQIVNKFDCTSLPDGEVLEECVPTWDVKKSGGDKA